MGAVAGGSGERLSLGSAPCHAEREQSQTCSRSFHSVCVDVYVSWELAL